MKARWTPALLVAGALFAGCSGAPGDPVDIVVHPPGKPADPGSDETAFPHFDACELTHTVDPAGPALLVRDPQVLAHFSLDRVLAQLLDQAGDHVTTPLELLQRLFDTEGSESTGRFSEVTHCDTMKNLAFANGPVVDCPRAEGALAFRAGLLTAGDPDAFEPVALVNRFDLTPNTLETCGEYRIVYAKRSGRTDPGDRVFLIFEGALANAQAQNGLLSCLPVVQAWADLEKTSDPDTLAAGLETIYFDGVPGFGPVVHIDSFGALTHPGASYGATRGQVRVSQHMADPWEMRELRLVHGFPADGGPLLQFQPATTRNNPLASLFDPAMPGSLGYNMQEELVSLSFDDLTAADPARIRMRVSDFFNAGESAVEGAAKPDFLSHAQDNTWFLDQVAQRLAEMAVPKNCPTGDPLTPESIVRRATTQTCAGCHTPQNFLGPDRSLGCGLTWPTTLGNVHIDENGAISPALQQVFLPARAGVVSTYLSSCDYATIEANFVKSAIPIPD